MFDQILAYLKEPAWWFSTVFVAVAASIIAAYGKEWIDRWRQRLSEQSRQKDAEQWKRMNAVVSAAGTDSTYLIMLSIRAATITILTLLLTLLFSVTMGVLADPTHACQNVRIPIDLPVDTCKVALTYFLNAYGAVMGFGVAFGMISSFASIMQVWIGFGEYRSKHDLPPMLWF